jgi:ssDNA-binding replication factor A large subunit
MRSRAGEPPLEQHGLRFSLGKSADVVPGNARTARDRSAASVDSLWLDDDTVVRHAPSLRSPNN